MHLLSNKTADGDPGEPSHKTRRYSSIDEEGKEHLETGITTTQAVVKVSKRNHKRLVRLDALLKRDRTHYQWDKHMICGFILLAQVLVGLMRGSAVKESILGENFYKCSP